MSPQSLIAHYRITAKLGEGGMGEVWRGLRVNRLHGNWPQSHLEN